MTRLRWTYAIGSVGSSRMESLSRHGRIRIIFPNVGYRAGSINRRLLLFRNCPRQQIRSEGNCSVIFLFTKEGLQNGPVVPVRVHPLADRLRFRLQRVGIFPPLGAIQRAKAKARFVRDAPSPTEGIRLHRRCVLSAALSSISSSCEVFPLGQPPAGDLRVDSIRVVRARDVVKLETTVLQSSSHGISSPFFLPSK